MKTLCSFRLLSYLYFISVVNADTLQARYSSACSLLQDRIYCFFGAHSTSDLVQGSGYRAIGEIISLNLSTSYDLNTVKSSWNSIKDSHYKTDGTIATSIVSVGGSKCVLDGGYNIDDPITNVTKIYDSNDFFFPFQSDGRNLPSPIFYGTATYLPTQEKVIYWGGLLGPYPGTPFNLVTVLPISRTVHTWQINNSSVASNVQPRFGHTASLEENGSNIFYIGGKTRQQNSSQEEFVSILTVLVYNTENSIWSIKDATSNEPTSISNRYLHTATTIPNTTLVIIYGGANNLQNGSADAAVTDYLYYFDTSTLTFTRKFEIGEQKPGPRYSHSAVYYNNIFFVLFGIDGNGYQTNDIHFMDTKRITWLPTFSPDSTLNQSDKKPLIIGASVGSFIAVAILLLGLFFHHRNKKQKKILEKKSNESLPKLHKEYQRFSEISIDKLQGGSFSGLPRYTDIQSEVSSPVDNRSPYGEKRSSNTPSVVLQKPNQYRLQQQHSIAENLTSSSGSDTPLTARPTLIKPSSNE